MQPPTTPTSNRRSHFPSSRQSFSAGSAAKPRRYQSRQNSFLRLFIGALAITASKTWVIDNHGGEGGGAGWLVLAYWASRVFVEGKQVWDGRRRKAFRLDATSNGIGVKVSWWKQCYIANLIDGIGLHTLEFQLCASVTGILHVSGFLRTLQVSPEIVLAILCLLGYAGLL